MPRWIHPFHSNTESEPHWVTWVEDCLETLGDAGKSLYFNAPYRWVNHTTECKICAPNRWECVMPMTISSWAFRKISHIITCLRSYQAQKLWISTVVHKLSSRICVPQCLILKNGSIIALEIKNLTSDYKVFCRIFAYYACFAQKLHS